MTLLKLHGLYDEDDDGDHHHHRHDGDEDGHEVMMMAMMMLNDADNDSRTQHILPSQEALRDFLRRCPALRQLEVSQCRTSQRIWAELGHCGEKGPQSCGKKPGFLQAMRPGRVLAGTEDAGGDWDTLRQSAVRDCLRCLLPGPATALQVEVWLCGCTASRL